jgi:phospholipid/cholesterol/gamma-HCH transport system permease protein
VLVVDDIMHGISKSVLFAILITVVGVVNGIAVSGGAEGVGRMTTRSVVHSISAIVITDMVFAFIVTRA